MPRAAAVTFAAVGLALAACGGGGSAKSTTSGAAAGTSAAAAPNSLAAKLGLSATRKDVQTPNVIAASGQDFQGGVVQRLPLAILHKDGTPVDATGKRVEVYLARDALTPPYGPFPAQQESIIAPGAPKDTPIPYIYVAHVKAPPGTYFVAASFSENGKRTSASGGLQLTTKAATMPVGASVPASATPTLTSTGGNLKALTTAAPPDTSLLRYSVADSLKAHVPFVVTFATPAFCQSRICGPTVSVVQEAQRELRRARLRFIHVEIYKDNDPAKGFNQWVGEWQLPTEPWTFVVGADGRLKTKFEGAVGVAEIVAAARAALRS